MRLWTGLGLLCAAAAVASSQTYTISPYAGGGGPPSNVAPPNLPIIPAKGIALDGSGYAYFSSDQNCVFKLDATHGTLTRFAGTCQAGYSGDYRPAIAAQLDHPRGLVVDGNGGVYIADSFNNRIRKVDPDGNIYTVAGNGTAGYSGDGGPATSAQLSNPQDVAVDSSGNLYIADTMNYRIRKVTPSGTISTFAGTGVSGYTGDGAHALSAQIGMIDSLVLDYSGNLYLGDVTNLRVRKIALSTGTITLVAGNGTNVFSGDNGPAVSAGLNYPLDLAVDGPGNLYIADGGHSRIRKVAADGTITTIAGTGTSGYSGDGAAPASAKLGAELGVAITALGDLYIVDVNNHRIRRVLVGDYINTVAGNGNTPGYLGDTFPAIGAQLFHPDGLALDPNDNVVIADGARIRKVAASNNIIRTIAGTGDSGYSGDGGTATSAKFRLSQGVAVDSAGNFFVADSVDYRIRRVTSSGTISTFAGTGTSGYSGDGGAATSAQLTIPGGLALDASGNLYVTDQNRIRKITTGGIISTIAGNGTSDYSGDGGPAASATLSYPQGLAFDAAGNLYIADFTNNVIRKIDTGGTITTVAGTGTMGYSGDGGPATSARLNKPSGVAVDSRGNLYITDTYNCRVRKVNASGTISTIAGNGTCSSTGQTGPATGAPLRYPTGIAVDATGRVFVASIESTVVRALVPSAPAAIGSDLDGDGKPDLLWQNDTTRQVSVWYLSGTNGNTRRGDTWIAQNGPQGWRAVGMADFDGDGKADLVWQHDTTRQVAVWYLGGPNGNTFQRDAWIAQNGPQGWRAVGLADFNADGKPDLVWQHDTTRQVAIWYLGGPNGNTFQSDGLLAPNGPANWRLVAMGDFNGDGKVDLVWQHDITRQVAVWYMGGVNGGTFQNDAWLAANGPQGWRVAGVADCNGDGKPDLLWQHDTTRQAVVWYLGGANGNTFQSDAPLTSTDPQGWTLVAP